nr:endonuclease/exonuclease/phosphatase family protein [Kineococcus siccus]
MRVATLNVRELLDDSRALRRVLRAAEADVVCLQEVPTHPFSGHRLGDLAADVGLWVAAAGRAGAGTAMLAAARVDVRAGQVRALPTPRFRDRRPVRRRGCAEAVVRVPLAGGWSRDVLVRSVHLGLEAGERERHAATLAPTAPLPGPCSPWREAPVVLGGDLNEGPEGAARQRLCTVLLDAATSAGAEFPTFPARAPHRRIDLVLVDPRLSVTGVRTPDLAPGDAAAATDHLAVVADLLVTADDA